MSERRKQAEKILTLLKEAKGGWVPLPEIMNCAAQYNARIFELRRAGHRIENRTQEVHGARHSWFRLMTESEQKPRLIPQPPTLSGLLATAPSPSTWLDYERGVRR